MGSTNLIWVGIDFGIRRGNACGWPVKTPEQLCWLNFIVILASIDAPMTILSKFRVF